MGHMAERGGARLAAGMGGLGHDAYWGGTRCWAGYVHTVHNMSICGYKVYKAVWVG